MFNFFAPKASPFKGGLHLYLPLLLSFSVLISKKVLIFNEETLVTISFFSFVFFIYFFYGETIQETLASRGEDIKLDFEFSSSYQETGFNTLLKEHQKSSLLKNLLNQTENLATALYLTQICGGDETVIITLFRYLKEKVLTLLTKYRRFIQRLQPFMANNLPTLILYHYLLEILISKEESDDGKQSDYEAQLKKYI